MSTENTAITQITDAELDAVGAAGFRFTFAGLVVAQQTNLSTQTSVNILSAGSGNQVAYQSNSVNIG